MENDWTREHRIRQRGSDLIMATIAHVADGGLVPSEVFLHQGGFVSVMFSGDEMSEVQYVASEDKYLVLQQYLVSVQTYNFPAEYDWEELDSFDNADEAIAEAIMRTKTIEPYEE